MTLDYIFICCLSIKEICSLIGAFTALITVLVTLCKYEEHIERDRIRYLLDFGNKYTSDPKIVEVINFLEGLEDDEMYKKECMVNNTYNETALPIHNIEMFMRFIEELELLIRSGAISGSAALNLFGYYTTILDKYHKRWPNLKYEEKYWNIYRAFVDKAKKFDYNKIQL